MPVYEYSIDPSDPQQISVRIYAGRGQAVAANAVIMWHDGTPVFESYATHAGHQGKGLSYALTHLMLLYCREKHFQPVEVLNAHFPLMRTLEALKFVKSNPRRDPTFKHKGAPEDHNTADFSCDDVSAALTLCKQKLLRIGLIEDGFRNRGPYQWP